MKYIKHIGIYVNNLEAMTTFYRTIFDLTPIVINETDCGEWLDCLAGKDHLEICITKLITQLGSEHQMGDMLELVQVKQKVDYQKTRHGNMTEPGTAHIAFGVENILDTIGRIEACGGKVVVAPFQRRNGKWISFAQDIENNWLELIQ